MVRHAKAEPTLVENQQAVIEYRPLGTILAIMPEFSIMAGDAWRVPIILAGNYLLKHAPNVMARVSSLPRCLKMRVSHKAYMAG